MSADDAGRMPPLSEVVDRSGVGWYPLVALGGLAVMGVVGGQALVVLLPDIARTSGIGPGGLSLILIGRSLLAALVALPLAGLVQRRAIRVLLAVSGAAVVAVLTMTMALSAHSVELIVVLLAAGAAGAVIAVCHQPLVIEYYPPAGRVRALAMLAGFRGVGQVTAPLLVGLLATVVGLTWRGVFLVVGGLGVVAAVAASVLRDPGFGRWDRAPVADGSGPDARDDLTVTEAIRRLRSVPTLRRLYAFQAGLGAMLVPLVVLLMLFLDVRWNLDVAGRGAVVSVLGLAAVIAVASFGRSAERWFHRDPRGLVVRAVVLWTAAVALIPVAALAPALVVVVLALALATGLVAAIGPALAMLHLSLVAPRLRSMSTALASAWFAGVGGPLGVLLFGTADRRYGLVGALALTALPGAAAVLLLVSARHTVVADLERVRTDARRIGRGPAGGATPSALSVRGLAAGYDDHEVLHHIDLEVAPGERVAVVGANGAGKSTMLHAIAGLVPVRTGIVQVAGRDLTHREAATRPGAGLVLVAGPGAVFDPLTVDEHLRLYEGRSTLSRAQVRRARDAVWDRFPTLAGRRSVQARDLSGGERRMLGLARALLMRPTVLLIDELTLGLADGARQQAIEIVHAAARSGSAVLFVDQSVDLAMSASDRVVLLADGVFAHDGPAVGFHASHLSANYLQGER